MAVVFKGHTHAHAVKGYPCPAEATRPDQTCQDTYRPFGTFTWASSQAVLHTKTGSHNKAPEKKRFR